MRFYSWFAFSAVSSVQCVVTFPCLAVLRQYPLNSHTRRRAMKILSTVMV
ncbi:hypothetical protein MJO29_015914 [Puccinia striiformis f. sp. tritici]|nr:hypothetical protein MJO29_015914 [Puccinia striiformis f. sp. tritici]